MESGIILYNSRSAMPSQLAYPEKITRLDRANGWRWRLAEAQAANDSARYSSRSALLCVSHSDYRPYFVRLAPFACRVLVHIS